MWLCFGYSLFFGLSSAIILYMGAEPIGFLGVGDARTVLSLKILAVSLPFLCFATIVLMGLIESVPIDLEEAAYLDGCNIFQIYFRIIMPTAKSSFATVAIYSFQWSYNDLFNQSYFLRYPNEKTNTLLQNESNILLCP